MRGVVLSSVRFESVACPAWYARRGERGVECAGWSARGGMRSVGCERKPSLQKGQRVLPGASVGHQLDAYKWSEVGKHVRR
eukprot:CAMPEP_0174889884 /NCGR_PEP_ID=MMETSP0167-20121228/5070_1 /TAXON_ID=38298 /ORGANISM="Rhodella maculata, Strain CCMP736" /LENGTH=80 /DNA_ID=CAMNT_0016127447 /DNA_START=443 /DNA_END=682 /DNA_ORIENTATION=-